jgi:hypothetical protein
MHGTTTTARAKRSRKAFWLKQLHTWHWISSAVSLVGLLLFAITGFTLNHAAEIEGSPQTVERAAQLPAPLLPAIKPDDAADTQEAAARPGRGVGRGQSRHQARARADAEWSADEIYLALPRPGGDGWVAIDRASGAVTTESTSRGWIAWLNDLHKGRNSGTVWKWFIDIFVLACIVFSLTGLVLLQMHSKNRPSTWPLVGAGLVIPAILAIFFIHI